MYLFYYSLIWVFLIISVKFKSALFLIFCQMNVKFHFIFVQVISFFVLFFDKEFLYVSLALLKLALKTRLAWNSDPPASAYWTAGVKGFLAYVCHLFRCLISCLMWRDDHFNNLRTIHWSNIIWSVGKRRFEILWTFLLHIDCIKTVLGNWQLRKSLFFNI